MHEYAVKLRRANNVKTLDLEIEPSIVILLVILNMSKLQLKLIQLVIFFVENNEGYFIFFGDSHVLGPPIEWGICGKRISI